MDRGTEHINWLGLGLLIRGRFGKFQKIFKILKNDPIPDDAYSASQNLDWHLA